jgi:hypothetical protein
MCLIFAALKSTTGRMSDRLTLLGMHEIDTRQWHLSPTVRTGPGRSPFYSLLVQFNNRENIHVCYTKISVSPLFWTVHCTTLLVLQLAVVISAYPYQFLRLLRYCKCCNRVSALFQENLCHARLIPSPYVINCREKGKVGNYKCRSEEGFVRNTEIC